MASSPALGPRIARVSARQSPCREHFELTLHVDDFPDAHPGQFLQVLCRMPGTFSVTVTDGVFLRRPFSIGGLARMRDGFELRLLGRVVGPGTAWLNHRQKGDVIDLLGPFGRSFSMPSAEARVILVAGGIGLPPIRWWSEILNKNGIQCEAVYGAQTRDLLAVRLIDEPSRTGEASLCVDEFSRANTPTALTTDDGSIGLHGRVTDVLARRFEAGTNTRTTCVYACGPEPMLEAVARLCARHGAWCEVAMERVMGCGMGTCQSCVVPVHDPTRANGKRYALCCREGPVFDAATVCW